MITEDMRALIKYRIEQADEAIGDAEALLLRGSFRATVNRAYYAMFYSILAMLNLQNEETSKHVGAISLFDREFVKTGVFGKEFSKWLHEAFLLRQKSDYGPLIMVSGDIAQETVTHSQKFVEQTKEYLAGKLT